MYQNNDEKSDWIAIFADFSIIYDFVLKWWHQIFDDWTETVPDCLDDLLNFRQQIELAEIFLFSNDCS